MLSASMHCENHGCNPEMNFEIDGDTGSADFAHMQ